jgi:hypothetical protein
VVTAPGPRNNHAPCPCTALETQSCWRARPHEGRAVCDQRQCAPQSLHPGQERGGRGPGQGRAAQRAKTGSPGLGTTRPAAPAAGFPSGGPGWGGTLWCRLRASPGACLAPSPAPCPDQSPACRAVCQVTLLNSPRLGVVPRSLPASRPRPCHRASFPQGENDRGKTGSVSHPPRGFPAGTTGLTPDMSPRHPKHPTPPLAGTPGNLVGQNVANYQGVCGER